MRFPRIDHQSALPVSSELLPLTEFFNPHINQHYRHGSSIDALENEGYWTLSKIALLMNSLITPQNVDEYLQEMIENHTGHSATTRYLPAYRAIYNALPLDKKYLIFQTYPDYVDSDDFTDDEHDVHNDTGELPNRPLRFRFFVKFPYRFQHTGTVNDRDYGNVGYDHHIFKITYPSEVTTDQLTELLTPTILNSFDNHGSKYIKHTSEILPHYVRNVMGYLTNQKVLSVFTSTGTSRYSPTKFKADFSDPGSFSINVDGVEIVIRPRVTDTNRSLIERVLNYTTNVLDYLPYSIKGPKEDKATLYGVELEACSDYAPGDVIRAQKALFFILKQDGSITGSKPQKYEMVTVPATLKAHKRLWAEFFSAVDYEKFDTTKDTGNGMHVHIDRRAFTQAHLNRFTWFITNPANFDFIFAVSERPTKHNLTHWAPVPSYHHYRSKTAACRNAVSRNGGLRGAVHFKGSKTVEVRLFKGIVSYATIVKNLEFVDSVVEYSRQTSLVQLSLPNYLAWLSATPANRYATLKTFLSELKLPQFITAAQVEDFIWLTDDPKAVHKKLLGAPFKITQDIVTYLNRKRRKRTFILKDGQLVCLHHNGGLLAKLDKSVQDKQLAANKTFKFSAV